MKLAVLMDDIHAIKPHKDSSLAMLRAAQTLGLELFVFNSPDMYAKEGTIYAQVQHIRVFNNDTQYVEVLDINTMDLAQIDIILMRKDPPFDMNYIYATYFLEQLQQVGVYVSNTPRSLRDFNEKVVITRFPHLIAPTLIASKYDDITAFCQQFDEVVLKPLDSMGGNDIFKHRTTDDMQKTISYLTRDEITPIMVQKFIPEISKGDKRIILIQGKAVPYALARIPAVGNFKGNIAQGASVVVQELSERDKYICSELEKFCLQNGLDFVGIDVIGDYLSEINITSPTGIREIDAAANTTIAEDYINTLITLRQARLDAETLYKKIRD